MIDIPQVEEKSLVPVGVIPSVHLGPPSQAGRNQMATVLLRAVLCQIFHEERSRADEAHLTFQDVEKSRKFIQAGTAHQLAESRESICIGQELPIGSTGIGHRSEFIQDKRLTVKPGAFLHEQEWPAMNDPRRQCDESDDRKQEREKADGHHQIEDALPREESGDGRLGGVDHVVHNGINFVMRGVR